MSYRDTPRYEFDQSRFFSELMQSGDHYPPLKQRMRDTFNRFELEDVSHLFATLAMESRVAWAEHETKRIRDGDENPEGGTDGEGEISDQDVPVETEAGRDESVGDDAGIDPSIPA